jgi:hypothetical protein
MTTLTQTPRKPTRREIAEEVRVHTHWLRGVADELDKIADQIEQDPELSALVDHLAVMAAAHPDHHPFPDHHPCPWWIDGLTSPILTERSHRSTIDRFGVEDYWPDARGFLVDVLAQQKSDGR